MKRIADNLLNKWKFSINRKPLLVRGARHSLEVRYTTAIPSTRQENGKLFTNKARSIYVYPGESPSHLTAS